MAISVRERTGELAVLKAIGFTDQSVLFFVLGEALLIALFGGLIGLALAIFAVPLIATALNGLLPPLILSYTMLALGLGFALIVGAASGGCFPALARCACASLTHCGGSDVAIPVVYNLRSVRARWTSAIVAVAGIAGTVGVFVAMLSLARGFRATLVSSGSEDNAIVMRAGATAEMMSSVDLDEIIQDAPGVAHDSTGPLVTSEVVAIAPFPMLSTGTDANVQVRGVSCVMRSPFART